METSIWVELAKIFARILTGAGSKFALKLFDNPEIEVSDAEKGYIKEALGNFLQWARIPVLEALGEKAE